MILSSAHSLAGQGNSHNDAELLESGKAEKLRSPVTAKEIKIISYNIRWRSGEQLEQIIRWLKTGHEHLPTIIGLQEVDRARKRSGNTNNARVVAESLGMHYAWAAPALPKRSQKKKKKKPVRALSAQPLTDITRIVLTTEGPGGRSRVALGATTKIGDTPIRVYSVHGETRLTMGKKIDQLRAVLDDLARFPKSMPAIVVGDFNTWELPVIENVRKLFTNADFTTPLPDDESTFLQKAVVFDLKLKLDWIWLRGLTPQSYGIDRKLKVSDHFPLWTVVKLPD